MLSTLGRQCMYFLSEFEILILNDLPSYLFDHVILPVALYGCYVALNKAKLLKIYIMIFLERLLV